MARAIRSSTLETRSARLKEIPVSIKPTFVRVAKGLGLGYRRRAWQTGLALIENENTARNVILADDVIRHIIAEAYNESREFGLFVELAAVTGARPSQIARLEVGDLRDGSEPRLMMPASRKGRGKKKISHYPVPISTDLANRLVSLYRPANALLITRPDGQSWKRSDQRDPFQRTAKACGQIPDEVTMYALRHSSIVRQLLVGVPVRIVAAGHDTSVKMIERTYSQHITDHADALVRGAMLSLTPRDKPKLAVIG